LVGEIDKLIRLQDKDKEIQKIKKRLIKIPGILKDIDNKIKQSAEIVDKIEKELKENQKKRRSLELDVEDYKQKVKDKKRELNDIKTNKEYSAMLTQIEFLNKKKEDAEDKVIASLLETDIIQNKIKDAKKKREEVKSKYEKEKEKINKEKEKLEKELAELKEKREKIVSNIDPEYLTLYNDLAKTKAGIPLSYVDDNNYCSECYIKVRPQRLLELKRGGKIITCENCGRILYLEKKVNKE